MKAFLFVLFAANLSFGKTQIPPDENYYRDLTLKVRQSGTFSVPSPGTQSLISYSFEFDQPVYPKPMLGDSHLVTNPNYFYRLFFDRILFKDGSFVEINGDKLPLTCLFIDGQDNRFSNEKPSPLLPEFVLKIYLVANDFSCQGPIKPGWPESGGKEQNWDTYLYFEIRDPTIMLPTEAVLRYRWNEFHMVMVDGGGQ